MAALLPVAEKNFEFSSRIYKLSKIAYDGTDVTFKVDQSAVSAVAVLPASGAPTVTLGAPDSNFEKTVTLAAAASPATVIIVTVHGKTVASTRS